MAGVGAGAGAGAVSKNIAAVPPSDPDAAATTPSSPPRFGGVDFRTPSSNKDGSAGTGGASTLLLSALGRGPTPSWEETDRSETENVQEGTSGEEPLDDQGAVTAWRAMSPDPDPVSPTAPTAVPKTTAIAIRHQKEMERTETLWKKDEY